MIITKVKEKVREYLQKYPELRDNDNKLVADIWRSEIPEEALAFGSGFNVLSLIEGGKVSNFKSICRIRAVLQKEEPELRGEKYKERVIDQNKETREDLGYSTKNFPTELF